MYEFLTDSPDQPPKQVRRRWWPLVARAGVALYVLAFIAFLVWRSPQPNIVASASQSIGPAALVTEMDHERGQVVEGESLASNQPTTETLPIPASSTRSNVPPATIAPSAAAAAAPLDVPISRPRAAPGRLRIPTIGVDAPIVVAGPPVNGQLQAPPDADSVVWYGFTAEPGMPGNVLIAGHVDLGQRTAVFWNLRLLAPGDTVSVRTSGVEAKYVVDRSYAVSGDTTDTATIIGTRAGPATLTLITCDGSFISSRHAYDQRRIVVASLRS
jgi:LPXTG-site transpeptidase (sortase) family protein